MSNPQSNMVAESLGGLGMCFQREPCVLWQDLSKLRMDQKIWLIFKKEKNCAFVFVINFSLQNKLL